MILLTLLGVGIGAATIDPLQGDSAAGAATGSTVYLAIVQLISLFAGGFAAARLAGVPFKQGSMLHGAAVWSLATFAMFWLATTAVGAVAGGIASSLSAAGSGVAAAADAAVPDDLSLSDLSLPDVDMQSLPPSVRRSLERRGLTLEQAQQASAEVEAAIEDAKAEAASSALSAAAFGAFVASLLGLIAAVGGALLGRPKEIVDPSARTA